MFKHSRIFLKKQEIRAEISRKRRYLSKKEKLEFDLEIIKKLKALKEWKTAKTILVYIPHKEEINTKLLIQNSFKNKKIIVPKTHLRFHSLSLHQLKSFEDLYKGRYGLLEPLPHTKMIDPKDIDLAVIPGTVFDKNGHRIGYGKGYFDKLNKHLKCPKIGLAYNFQIIENIPVDKHDEKIDILISEKHIFIIKT
jgi:5-formyltetrahydrofolate cyclo-ligase